jgi:hypothetical protein
VDEVGLIDIVGRWNSSLNINLTPVVDDEDRLPFAWAGQAPPRQTMFDGEIAVSDDRGIAHIDDLQDAIVGHRPARAD